MHGLMGMCRKKFCVVIAGLMTAVLILFGYGHITYQNHHLICTMYAVDADIS